MSPLARLIRNAFLLFSFKSQLSKSQSKGPCTTLSRSISLSILISLFFQECVLAGAWATDGVLNFALMTVTAPTRKSAAPTGVDMSAWHRT